MFTVGQRVWHRGGQRSGTVLECQGNRVFIEQDNGAELDFLATDLTAIPPAGAIVHAADIKNRPQLPTPVPSRLLKPSDIAPEHQRVLAIVPVRTLQAVASVFERRSNGRRFSTLDIAEKLNVIADITKIPYRTMREYRDRPGELGLMMGKGLADQQKTP